MIFFCFKYIITKNRFYKRGHSAARNTSGTFLPPRAMLQRGGVSP
ncbi:MAG: hypothetical protein HPY66_3514 [Firmicutes bacterium]|nr:hypothetical protein [Bacillota bacterium]